MRKIKVKVIANAKRERVVAQGEILKAYVSAPAVEGKANKALINLLAGYFKIKKSGIKIVSGEKSREKIVQIG